MLVFWLRESFKEEWTEELFVVSVRTLRLAFCQFGVQIVYVVVQETFLLNEVDKH